MASYISRFLGFILSCGSRILRFCLTWGSNGSLFLNIDFLTSCGSRIVYFSFYYWIIWTWDIKPLICGGVLWILNLDLWFDYVIGSCGFWIMNFHFVIGSFRSWILNFDFVVGSWGSWLLYFDRGTCLPYAHSYAFQPAIFINYPLFICERAKIQIPPFKRVLSS